MTAFNQNLQQLLEKGQGTAARALDKLPSFVQDSLAKALGYPYIFPDLDPFIKCMMAAQLKQGRQGFIGAGIAGEALVLFHDSSFADLGRLMGHDGSMTRATELELLMDMSNVLIGAFLRGFANQLDTPFSQGHPVVLGQHRPIEELIQANKHRWKRTLAIEINYQIRNHQVQCDLLLLFTEDSIQFMNHKIEHLM